MKKDLHPSNYRTVLFIDTSNGYQFLIDSTVESNEKGIYEKDKKEYPVCRVEISNATHPFYTGQDVVMDTAGRVDKFKKRIEATNAKKSK